MESGGLGPVCQRLTICRPAQRSPPLTARQEGGGLHASSSDPSSPAPSAPSRLRLGCISATSRLRLTVPGAAPSESGAVNIASCSDGSNLAPAGGSCRSTPCLFTARRCEEAFSPVSHLRACVSPRLSSAACMLSRVSTAPSSSAAGTSLPSSEPQSACRLSHTSRGTGATNNTMV